MEYAMRSLIIAAAAVLLLPIAGLTQNPDVRPSVGIEIGGSAHSATTDIQQFTRESDISSFGLSMDFRLPLNETVTLDFALGFSSGKIKGEENDAFLGYEDTRNGYTFSAGARFYFGKDVNKR
jgi:hypothetical protein